MPVLSSIFHVVLLNQPLLLLLLPSIYTMFVIAVVVKEASAGVYTLDTNKCCLLVFTATSEGERESRADLTGDTDPVTPVGGGEGTDTEMVSWSRD